MFFCFLVITMNILMSGLPGKVATAIAENVLESTDFSLSDYGLTGVTGPDKWKDITLLNPSQRELYDFSDIDCVIDYTHPSAVLVNAEFYCRKNIPFVMGTSGGDRDALEKLVRESSIPAVIAQNMSREVVAFQAMIAYAAEQFPNIFSNFSLDIFESHQQSKADTSGTAKSMIRYFNQMGISFDQSQIRMMRDPDAQRAYGIPEEHLRGHAWHTYTLKSPDKSIALSFTHNVCGRNTYVAGTLAAVRFLGKRISEGATGMYSMIDVLHEG